MSEYDNTNTGALFKNDKKSTERHPDYQGTVNIDGVEYWQSAWLKKSKSGATFMSQSFKRKDEAPSKPQAKAEPALDPFATDDVPF